MPWLEWLDRGEGIATAGKAPYRLLEPHLPSTVDTSVAAHAA